MKSTIYVTIFMLLPCFILSAQQDQRERDIEGSRDCELFSRFPGAVIEFYQESRFDRYSLLMSKITWDEEQEKNVAKTLDVEGRVIKIQYTVPVENNAYFLYKSYLDAMVEANHEILYKVFGEEEMGVNSPDFFYFYYEEINPVDAAITPFGEKDGYIASKYVDEEKTSYVSICVIEDPEDWNFSLINLDIIEVEPMETGLITAKMMADNISLKGHVSIYGIYFDTGKSEVKPESKNALEEIADFLKSNPDDKYYIVGHTDNVGDYDSNSLLSENRAKEVVKILVNEFGVDPAQLEAHGVSSLAPVTSNKSDYGKVRNRRVELVEQ